MQVFPYTCKDLTLRTKEVWWEDAEIATPSSPVSEIILLLQNLISNNLL